MTREEAMLVTQKIEEAEARAEARTEAMLDRLIEQHSQATTPAEDQKYMDLLERAFRNDPFWKTVEQLLKDGHSAKEIWNNLL